MRKDHSSLCYDIFYFVALFLSYYAFLHTLFLIIALASVCVCVYFVLCCVHFFLSFTCKCFDLEFC